ncbi:MAG: hypothetical protein EPN97_09575 [Alphaproteobacteria bacterium]|nr:MAG: hypothetical protein EPN97_09575 [Alphaproteobacteria bacterium]
MKKFVYFAMIFSLLLSGAALAQGVAKEPPKDDEYLAMVKQAMRDPTEVDWVKLRKLYAQSSFYPESAVMLWQAYYTAGKTAAFSKMPDAQEKFKDMQKQQYANYTSHVYSIRLAKETSSDIFDAAQEQQALEAIADSIVGGGDGKTPATAFEIVTPDEEKLVVETYLGGTIQSQARSGAPGSSLDTVTYLDPATKKSAKVYFNTNIITKRAGK